MTFERMHVLATALVLLATSCASSRPPAAASVEPPAPPAASSAPVVAAIPDAIDNAVNAPDRDAADRDLDAGRHPAEMLRFFQIQPGMKVADIAAGGGYTTELLARTVGESGQVYGTNSQFILERFAEQPWSARLQKPVMKNVIRVDREFSDPLPPEAKDLDAVLIILFYHDMVWQKVDRAQMNSAIFAALKKGGIFGVIDHSSRSGAGTTQTETLHRIEQSVVRDEITRAGFVPDGEATFLKSPDDTRDWSASPRTAGERRGTSDRFVLRFKKP